MFFVELEPIRLKFALKEKDVIQVGINRIYCLVAQYNQHFFLYVHPIGGSNVEVDFDVLNLIPWDDGLGGDAFLAHLRSCINIRKRQMAWRDDNSVV